MSLLDYLGNDPAGRASSSSSPLSLQVQQLLAARQQAAGTAANGQSGSGLSSLLITMEAQRAAANAADAKKDATSLTREVRATLDAHKASGKALNISAFSGRALAIVALNEADNFTRAEVAAAKAQLRERDRASALALIRRGDLTAASLKSYSQQLLAARDAMSAEELRLRDGNSALR